jgi:anaphase-promoting complex subunit 1
LTYNPATEGFDDRIPVWPPDISAILYGRISNPDWQVPWHDTHYMATRFGITPAFTYGRFDPLQSLYHLTGIYRCLADSTVKETQKRAEHAVYLMVTSTLGPDFVNRLPMGIAAPLMEALRTCQMSPPGDWPLAAYRAIGRNDLAASGSEIPDMLFSDGYRPMKDLVVRRNSSNPTLLFSFTSRIHHNVVGPLARLLLKLGLQRLEKLTLYLVLKLTLPSSQTSVSGKIAD